jgi:TPR repeat protein
MVITSNTTQSLVAAPAPTSVLTVIPNKGVDGIVVGSIIAWRKKMNVWNQQQRTSSSTILTHNKDNKNKNDLGEELYQRARQALREATEFEEQLEQERNRQQYEAFQQQEELKLKQQQQQHDKDDNDSTNTTTQSSIHRRRNTGGGVAVVKTIAKQTRDIMGEKQQQQAPHELKRQEGWALMELAALQYGHKDALVELGTAAATTLEHKDLSLAKDYYRRAGEQGSPDGWFNLGNLLWQEAEEESSAASAAASMDAFHKAIELGDADAMYFVGVHYLSNDDEIDVEVYRQGLNFIQGAADQGHFGALHYLALFYLNGNKLLGIDPCSTSDFLAHLDKACMAGSPDALFLRGHAYYYGEHGMVQSYPHALRDFQSAAEAGHADAAVSAGAMLHQGIGNIIPRDQRRAFQLYQEAGELGSTEGWRNVVACYALGEGVPQSKAMAQYIAKIMLKDDDHDPEEK